MNIEDKIKNEPALVEWETRIRELIVSGNLQPSPAFADEVVIRIDEPSEALNLFRAASIYLSMKTHVFSTFKIVVKLSFPDDYYAIDWNTMKEVAIVNNELVSNMLGTKRVHTIYVDLE